MSDRIELKQEDKMRAVYVAGKWAAKAELKEHMIYLARHGFVQTYD